MQVLWQESRHGAAKTGKPGTKPIKLYGFFYKQDKPETLTSETDTLNYAKSYHQSYQMTAAITKE